jgi:hypothetical protein
VLARADAADFALSETIARTLLPDTLMIETNWAQVPDKRGQAPHSKVRP